MSNLDKVKAIIKRYKIGDEELDAKQLFEMLEFAVDGLDNCDADGAAKDMIQSAGYSLY